MREPITIDRQMTYQDSLVKLIGEVKPRVIFGMWPIDRHPDHMMAGSAAAQTPAGIIEKRSRGATISVFSFNMVVSFLSQYGAPAPFCHGEFSRLNYLCNYLI